MIHAPNATFHPSLKSWYNETQERQMNPVIQLQKLTKYYGEHRGVLDLDMNVMPGGVFGYLGPNGAGKTTTIRLLLDLIRPTGGSASVLGLDAQADSLEIRRRIGYLPADPSLYDNLTGKQFLLHVASLKGGIPWTKIKRLADRLNCDLSRNIRTLSHGNRQKIAVIRAFMHDPELLILDEPTSGLDPLIQQEFERMVMEAKADGRTVFLSSHILKEVEDLCDRVAIIRDGRLVAIEDVAVFKARSIRSLEIRFGAPVSESAFQDVYGVRNVVVDGSLLKCEVIGSLDRFIKTAAQFEVVDMTVHEPGLEEIFLAFYRDEESDASA